MSHNMDKMKRRRALIAALDRVRDVFLCQLGRLPVELEDNSSHKFIQFDHIKPIKTSEFQVLWAVFNQMKGGLADDEFKTLIAMLRDHWLGAPFDKDKVKFLYWNRKPLKASKGPIVDLLFGEAPTDRCIICGDKSHPRSVYCPRCRRFFRERWECLARRAALIAAWNPIKRKFICKYTGVELDDNVINGPWSVSFDHGIPGQKGNMVVAALWSSIMKIDLARDEFYAVINELARVIETGDHFDERVCAFLYWKRRKDGTRKLELLPVI
jgi:hypothetical protein